MEAEAEAEADGLCWMIESREGIAVHNLAVGEHCADCIWPYSTI
jgi:hypothetical protein